MEKLSILLLWLIPFVFSLCVHEYAHAWVANARGDATAKLMGRLTLNPLAHADPVGTIFFPLLSFWTGFHLIGWARPVPVNERNLKNLRWDGLWVALAGPLSNIILAVGFAVLLFALGRLLPTSATTQSGFMIREPLFIMVIEGININLILAFFNLLPIPPLDGSHVLSGLYPRIDPHLAAFEKYGFLLLLVVLYTPLRNIVFVPSSTLFHLLVQLAT